MNSGKSSAGPYATALEEEVQEHLKSINGTDIIIGIPSYNNAESIGRVIKASELGLAKYFPRHKGIIIISEGGDVEDTRKAVDDLKDKHYFENAFVARPSSETEIIVTKYRGASGKGTGCVSISP